MEYNIINSLQGILKAYLTSKFMVSDDKCMWWPLTQKAGVQNIFQNTINYTHIIIISRIRFSVFMCMCKLYVFRDKDVLHIILGKITLVINRDCSWIQVWSLKAAGLDLPDWHPKLPNYCHKPLTLNKFYTGFLTGGKKKKVNLSFVRLN